MRGCIATQGRRFPPESLKTSRSDHDQRPRQQSGPVSITVGHAPWTEHVITCTSVQDLILCETRIPLRARTRFRPRAREHAKGQPLTGYWPFRSRRRPRRSARRLPRRRVTLREPRAVRRSSAEQYGAMEKARPTPPLVPQGHSPPKCFAATLAEDRAGPASIQGCYRRCAFSLGRLPTPGF
jgi:hypothetical protein